MDSYKASDNLPTIPLALLSVSSYIACETLINTSPVQCEYPRELQRFKLDCGVDRGKSLRTHFEITRTALHAMEIYDSQLQTRARRREDFNPHAHADALLPQAESRVKIPTFKISCVVGAFWLAFVVRPHFV